MQSHDVVATPATSSPTIVAEGNTVPTAETATTSPMDTLPKMTGPNNPQSNETIITPDPKNYHIDVTKSPGDEHRVSLEGGPKSGKEQGSPAQGRGEVHGPVGAQQGRVGRAYGRLAPQLVAGHWPQHLRKLMGPC